MTTDEKTVEQDLRQWVAVLRMALEDKNKAVAMYCIREIENIVSNVCYMYDLWLPIEDRKEILSIHRGD